MYLKVPKIARGGDVLIARQSFRRNCCFQLVHMVAPIVAGGVLYLSWAPSTLKLFSWLDRLGMTPVVRTWRQWTWGYKDYVPGWVIYHVPDFLWVYALTMIMAGLWWQETDRRRLLIYTGLVMGSGWELGQLTGWIAGTFDPLDLIAEVIACFTALAVFCRSMERSDAL